MSENKKVILFLLVCATAVVVVSLAGCQLGGPEPTRRDLARDSAQEWCGCVDPDDATCPARLEMILCSGGACDETAKPELRRAVEQCTDRECDPGESPCGL